jgi:hypothetical protein
VRDPAVAEALTWLRPGQWRRAEPVALTDHFTSRRVRVEDVTATSTARSSQGFTLDLMVDAQPPSSSSMRMAVNGLGPDDVVEHGLRHRLLGEPLPAALDGMGFLIPSVSLDPVHGLPPEVAGSVAQLLLVEALVGRGSRVVRIRTVVVLPDPLGPSRATRVPAGTVRSTPVSTRVLPKDLVTSWAWIAASSIPDPILAGDTGCRWVRLPVGGAVPAH